jgi:hypothetical protein
VPTVNVLGLVQVDAQDAPVGERQNQDIIRDLGGDKVGGDGELKLYALDHEHGQRAVVEVEDAIAGGEAVGCIQGHSCGVMRSCCHTNVSGCSVERERGRVGG